MVLEQRRIPFEFFFLAAVVVAVSSWIGGALSSFEGVDAGTLAVGVTLDLTVLIPVLYYALAVRRSGWPAVSVIPVFLVCVFVGTRILPPEHHGLLDLLQLAVPVLEIGLLAFVVVAVRRALRARESTDWGDAARAVVERLTGNRRAADIVAFEASLLAYALTWRKPPEPRPGEFTYHRKTPLYAYTGVLLFVIAAEAVAVHFLLVRWSPTVAWIVMALTVYSAVWLVGDVRAVARRPMRVTDHGLKLRFGLRWSLDVPWKTLERVQAGGSTNPAEDGLRLVPMGAGANCRLSFREPVEALGPYGIRRQVSSVELYVDDRAAFQAACEEHLADRSG